MTSPRSRAAYQAERRRHSVLLTFRDEEEKLRFQACAKAAGYVSVNAYLVQLLHNATSGTIYPPDYVESLKREVEKLRTWLDQAREENTDLRKDTKTLAAQKETLVFLLQDLPGGKEVADEYRRASRLDGVKA
ncbi:MAG: hypothetical protein ACYDCK_02610 [Thermoplasmatota archaeon]